MAVAVPRRDRLEVGGSSRVAELRRMAAGVAPVSMAGERLLPLHGGLQPLLGAGLRRGATVTVGGGHGATSLALALLAEASRAGSWCAVVGAPALHPPAAAALGVDLSRLALVPDAAEIGHWPTVTGALVDALDVVVAAVPAGMRPADGRRLATRARERGCVLVPLLGPAGQWPEGADARLRVTASRWWGLGQGSGHLTCREVEVEVAGRGALARTRRVGLWLPGPDGSVGPSGVPAGARDDDGGPAGVPAGAQEQAG